MALSELQSRKVLLAREEIQEGPNLWDDNQVRIQKMFEVLEVPGYIVPDFVWGLLINQDDPSLVVLMVEVVNADDEDPNNCVQFYTTRTVDGEIKWRWRAVERPEDDPTDYLPMTLWVDDPDPVMPPHLFEFRDTDSQVNGEIEGVEVVWDCFWPDKGDEWYDKAFQKQILRATDSYEFDNEGDDDLLTEEDS